VFDFDGHVWDAMGKHLDGENVKESQSDESRNDINLGEEFDAFYKQYKAACESLQWKELFPKLLWAKKEVKFSFDVDMGHVIKKLIKQDPDKKRFGHLPMMAVASRGSIGGILPSSLCERITSCGQPRAHGWKLSAVTR
jgi:hypothetical protein